jgi:hypothetical protein
MAAKSTITRALSRPIFWSSLIIALVALSAQPLRSEDCIPGWETFPVFQTNAVYAVYEYEGIVYRGGWFSLFRWIDNDWEIMDIGGDMGSLWVDDFRAMGDLLVIGGYFPTAGGMTVNSIATWDGDAFGALGTGVDGIIGALVIYNGDLIAGGGFDHASGVPAQNIARWDGDTWHPLGSGVSGPAAFVQEMVVWRGDLYAVGDFTHAGDSEVFYVARWDGATWSDVGGGVSMIGGGPTGLRGICVHDDTIVIVGTLDFAGGVPATNIAQWDGETWSALGSGSDPYDDFWGWRQAAHSAASYKGLLYVGAEFTDTLGDAARCLAVWDGENWQPVDDGLEGEEWPVGPYIRDLEIAGAGVTASLLMGGTFNEANNEETDNVARYTNCDDITGIDIGDGIDRFLQVHLNSNLARTSFQYTIQLERQSKVSAALYDVQGRRIKSLFSQPLSEGGHRFQLDFDKPEERIGGVYFLRVEAEGSAVTKKLILIP